MNVTVPSEKDPTVTYQVDLDAQTCTCPHFQTRLRGTGKLCKHLAQANLNALPPIGQDPPPPAAIPLGPAPVASEDTIPWDSIVQNLPDAAPTPPTADDEAFWAELMKPDPDPDVLSTAVAVQGETRLQEATAGHLVRAILKAEASVEALEKRAREDAQAWQGMITKASDQTKAWRKMILNWMLSNGITKLQTPWASIYPIKGRTTISVVDADQCIAACKRLKATQAVETVERLVKKEFDAIYNARPELFRERPGDLPGVTLPAIAEEKTGDPSLGIRRK